MRANSLTIFSLFYLVAFGSPAQHRMISLIDTNKSVPELLKMLEQKAGIYFSYDPAIMPEERLNNIRFINQPIEKVLDQLLRPRFTWKAIGEYIIISPQKVKEAPKVSAPSPPPTQPATHALATAPTGATTPLVVYDTITLLKTSIVYDTIHITKTKVVSEIPEVKKNNPRKGTSLSPLLSVYSWRSRPGETNRPLSYTGTAIGIQRAFQREHLIFQAALKYHFLFHNLSYIADSVQISDSSSILLPGERINKLAYGSASVTIGYQKQFRAYTAGIEAGISVYHALMADEKIPLKNREVISTTFSDHRTILFNATVSIPVSIKLGNGMSFQATPFAELGVNRFSIGGLSIDRRIVGMSFSIIPCPVNEKQ